jgi:hypothetical protein
MEFHDSMSLSRMPVRLQDSINTTAPSPPRSALVTKLFSNSKANKTKGNTPKSNSQQTPAGKKGQPQDDGGHSRTDRHDQAERIPNGDVAVAGGSVVDARVAELENEIKEFKRQNKLLQELRTEAEKERETLKQEQVRWCFRLENDCESAAKVRSILASVCACMCLYV